jgi:hypothetical protein
LSRQHDFKLPIVQFKKKNMVKHHEKKPHEKAVGFTLIGETNELIETLISNQKKKDWAINQIRDEGPGHKQVHNALLLSRLFSLVEKIEKTTGTSFELQEGYEVTASKHEHETKIPVPFPLQLGKNATEKKEIVQALSKAPEHELLCYAMFMQVIEWAINALQATGKRNTV